MNSTSPSYNHTALTEDALTTATAQIVSALASNPNSRITKDDLPGIITEVRASLENKPEEPKAVELVPAVPVKRSVTPEYVICLEDGKKFKSLKRHLQHHYNMTPAEYRAKWGLPNDYPMVAPNYAQARSELAKKMGLGQRNAPVVVETKPKRGGGKKAAPAT